MRKAIFPFALGAALPRLNFSIARAGDWAENRACAAITRRSPTGALTMATLSLLLSVTSANAQSKSAQVFVHGKSVQLLPSSPLRVVGFGDVTTYFTTFNGTSGSFLIDSARGGIVSGELRPRTTTAGLYEGAYAQATPLLIVDFGSYAVSLPTADSDQNGIPDAIQFDRDGNFSASGSGFSVPTGLPFSISIRFNRSAGSADGTYTATTQNAAGQANTVSGQYSLLSYQGSVSYTRGSSNTMGVSVTGLFQGGVTLTGSTTFTTANADQLSYAAFTGRDSAGTAYQARAGTLTRSGNTYRGDLVLVDGLPQTSWADFTSYVFVITDLNDANGNGIPDFTDPAAIPPVITTQPRSQSATVGQVVSLSVVATGAPSFQWAKGGTAIQGATSASLSFPSVQLSDSGSYTVVVSNSSGTVTSSAAALTVTAAPAAPTFVVQPFSLTVARGVTAVLVCEVAGSPSPTLQWKRNGITLSGATTRTLLLSPVGSTLAGGYTCTATNSVGTTTSTLATLAILDTTDLGRLVNLSIRTNAGAGAETLITGFSVGGVGAIGSKPLLLRAMGPSLSQFGVPGVLGDPLLTVYSGAVATAMNDDWAGDSQLRAGSANVGAFAFAGDTSKDAAVLAPSVAIGSYTAQISGVEGATGVVLAEIYDATPAASITASTPRLVNVSARAKVGTSSDMLIAGFVIGGSTAKTLLVRAVGPTLTSFGVTGVLLDPKLELYSGTRLLGSSDDWGNDSDIAYAAALVGGFPLASGSKDSAILISLPPGSYTAQVSGVANTTGVGLVELYDVPTPALAPSLGNQLVAYYALNGNTNDSSGNQVSATGAPSVTFSTDRFGRASSAATFGKTGFIDISNRRLLHGATEATISVWFESRMLSSEGGFLVAAGDARAGLDPFYLSIGNSGVLSAEFTDSSLGPSHPNRSIGGNQGLQIPTGQWIHVVVQFRSVGSTTVFELYVDGQLRRQTAYPRSHRIFFDTSMSVQIGCLTSFSDASFRGKIDEVRFYSRMLTPAEVQNLFESTAN